jgi:hypothetical protein
MSDAINPDGTPSAAPDGVTPPAPDSLGWRAQLVDGLKTDETFTPYKTLSDFAKAHLDTVGKVKDLEGKVANAIPKPAENATQQEKDAYLKAIGRPDKPDDYEIKPADGLPQNPELLGLFKNWAFELGFSKDQASGLSARWDSFMGKMAESQRAVDTKALVDGQENLKKTWGAAYDANAETVKKAFTAFKSEPFDQFLATEVQIGDTKIKIGNHPAIMVAFLDIGKKMLPDTAPAAGGSGSVEDNAKKIVYKRGNPSPQ